MKTIISILATVAFVLTFGTAFAAHEQGKHQSTDVIDAYRTFAHSEDMTGAVGAAAGGLRIEKAVGIWDSLFGNLESTDVIDPYRTFPKSEMSGASGVAPGGLRVAGTGKGSASWDILFGNFESTDVLDTYRGLAK